MNILKLCDNFVNNKKQTSVVVVVVVDLTGSQWKDLAQHPLLKFQNKCECHWHWFAPRIKTWFHGLCNVMFFFVSIQRKRKKKMDLNLNCVTRPL